jgi:glycosyltransferase involved in cell wall biosynthesis
MRIVIDLQGLQSKASGHRGVGRYTNDLVKALLKNNKKHEFYLAMNGALDVIAVRDSFESVIDSDHLVVWQHFLDNSSNRVPSIATVHASEIIREAFLYSLEPDVIFSTNLQEGRAEPAVTSVKKLPPKALFFSTLHDLVPLYYQVEYLGDELTKSWYSQKIGYAQESDVLITPSHSSKADIVRFLNVDPNKIVVIENGCDQRRFNSAPLESIRKAAVLSKYGIDWPYIFYVGGNDKHKNIERLIRAYARDSSVYEKVKLLLAGPDFIRDRHIKELICELNLTAQVLLIGFVDEADLPALYKSSKCFVFASTHEGFGLPALEAMACGVPVIGSNQSSVRELINNSDAVFDPYSIEDISKKIKRVIFDESYSGEVISSGLKEAARYTWDIAANKLLAVFDSLDASSINTKNVNKRRDSIDGIISAIALLAPRFNDDELLDISRSISETFEVKRKPKIYVDLSAVIIHDDKSGIQRVTRAIASELLKKKNVDVEIVYTCVGDTRFFKANKYTQTIFGVSGSLTDERIEFNKNDTLIYLDLHPGIAISHKPFTTYLRGKGVKIYYVVYDILPLLQPDTFWPELCAEFDSWIEAVSLSDGALCISKSVATELKHYLEKYGERRREQFHIGWFHLGADIERSAPSMGGLNSEALLVLQKLQSTSAFLMVGTVEPRKGHRQTLSAFELLWSWGFKLTLVIVGRPGWGMRDFEEKLISHREINKQLFWLNGISDEYLVKIYSSSTCLIAASEGEGFGLPLIEAAQFKLPMIIRDIPVFREVAGNNSCYFPNNNSPDVLAKTIAKWIDLYKKGAHPNAEKMGWLTWEQSANQLINIIDNDHWEYKVRGGNALAPNSLQDHHSRKFIWHGFSGIENAFRWTDGYEASLEFYWAEEVKDAPIRISCHSLGRQEIKLILNDVAVFGGIVNGRSNLIFGVENLKKGYNRFNFILPNAKATDSDTRLLALAIREVIIYKSPEAIVPGAVHTHHSHSFIWRNFSIAEATFRWTDGHEASLGFNWKKDIEIAAIRILCNSLGLQKIKIILNAVLVFDDAVEGLVNLIVNVENLKRGFNYLEFILPDAKQPSDGDRRLLALAVSELEILQTA